MSRKSHLSAYLGAFIGLMGWAFTNLGLAASLSPQDCNTVISQAIAQANIEPSLLRPNATTKMHIACINRQGIIKGFHSMSDAWTGSIYIAKAKGYTAAAFSSDENALTTRSIGELSQPGGPLWQIGNSNLPGTANGVQERGIIEFPGGLPLYKDGELVGGVGVSGDGVDQDECVAIAGAVGFDSNGLIRIDTVTAGGVQYTSTSFVCATP